MAANHRMHPRNIYRNPPDFKELAIKHPEFRKYVKQELNGKMSLDFGDPKAVAELTKTLLLNDFNLNVEIAETRLIPRVPLCLNYILWIEDLLTAIEPDRQIFGIDIGTGCISIYSLLASKKGWKMLATEADESNFSSAKKNVQKNDLGSSITVKLVKSDEMLQDVIDENQVYDFCMCNPPFYDTNEKPVNRTMRRKEQISVSSNVDAEIVTTGGELAFIKKMIKESESLKSQIKIYTTLVGKKADFLVLKDEVKKLSPKSFTTTEFCQGRTLRWGLAWSYLDIDLKKASNLEKNAKKAKNKLKPALKHALPTSGESFLNVTNKVMRIMDGLKLKYKKESSSDNHVSFNIAAYENTWSHQRRKKRENKRKIGDDSMSDTKSMDAAAEDTNEDLPQPKKQKLDEENIKAGKSSKTAVVECCLIMTLEDNSVNIEMPWLAGGKEYVHQILQYIKNNWT